MLPSPRKPQSEEAAALRPLFDLLADVLVTPGQLAEHWGYTENHLSNLRRKTDAALPFVKLPTGGIRYRMSEILAAEIAGTSGPLTLDRVLLAVAACKTVPAEHRAALVAHLTAALRPRG